ncbi:TraX family protein [Enterobacter hormaechei]|uniref:TraX family protein n=1 Tax=Enterobacter hormaechei TaxID=158836 RepID=UPI001F61C8D0|nr:TraX family protein [Enterobacter hormaechei]
MNDFHILSICIQNKDVAGAMRVLCDKSEFAVRKILEKLKVRVTTQTGRAFWHYVQGWLLTACRRGIYSMNRSVPDVLPTIRNASQLSPAALDMAKLLALLAMIIDHTNTVFLSPAPVMYALGRMAFPCSRLYGR